MRRRLEFLADQVGWLLGDAACLAMMALFMKPMAILKFLLASTFQFRVRAEPGMRLTPFWIWAG